MSCSISPTCLPVCKLSRFVAPAPRLEAKYSNARFTFRSLNLVFILYTARCSEIFIQAEIESFVVSSAFRCIGTLVEISGKYLRVFCRNFCVAEQFNMKGSNIDVFYSSFYLTRGMISTYSVYTAHNLRITSTWFITDSYILRYPCSTKYSQTWCFHTAIYVTFARIQLYFDS